MSTTEAREQITALSELSKKVQTLQDALHRKTLENDALVTQSITQANNQKRIFAHHLLRDYVRSFRLKRRLMTLYFSALEMEDAMKTIEQSPDQSNNTEKKSPRKGQGNNQSNNQSNNTINQAINKIVVSSRANNQSNNQSSNQSIYQANNQPSKATLKKLAYLYTKRPFRITVDLDDYQRGSVKPRFFELLNELQKSRKENLGLFARNIALAKENLEEKEKAVKYLAERDEAVNQSGNQALEIDQLKAENQKLREKLAALTHENEVRKKKENQKFVQQRAMELSKTFQSINQVNNQPLSPQPKFQYDYDPNQSISPSINQPMYQSDLKDETPRIKRPNFPLLQTSPNSQSINQSINQPVSPLYAPSPSNQSNNLTSPQAKSSPLSTKNSRRSTMNGQSPSQQHFQSNEPTFPMLSSPTARKKASK